MEEALMDGLSDRGSIPLSSILVNGYKKCTIFYGAFFISYKFFTLKFFSASLRISFLAMSWRLS